MSLAIPLLVLALAAASAKEDRPVDRRPRFAGIGLIVGASVAGAASIGLTSAVFKIRRAECSGDPDGSDDGGAASDPAEPCGVYETYSLWLPSIFTNLAALGLASAAGAIRGRHDAWRFRTTGRPVRRDRVIVGVGVGLAVAVPAVLLTSLVAVPSDERADHVVLLAQLGAASLGAGLGLWTYGAAYNANKNKTASRFALLPQLAPDRVGLSLASRF